MNPKVSLVIGIICISFSPIFVKLAGVSPISTSFYRLFVAWLLLAPYCIAKRRLKIERKALLITLAGGIVFGLDIYVWNVSLHTISATVSTLLANLTPIWVGLLSFILFKRRSGKMFWAGTAIAMVGMVLLVGYENILRLQFSIGIILALLSSLLYTIFLMMTKSVLKTISTQTFMFYNMLASCVFLLMIATLQQNNMVDYPAKALFCFLGLGVICQLSGWLAINRALTFLDSTKVSIALLSVVAFAGFLAAMILNEKLAFSEILGSVIVLAGIAITFLKPGRLVLK